MHAGRGKRMERYEERGKTERKKKRETGGGDRKGERYEMKKEARLVHSFIFYPIHSSSIPSLQPARACRE
jgi:hypothetical protein